MADTSNLPVQTSEGQPLQPRDVQQIIAAVLGQDGYGFPWRLNVEDETHYLMTLQNKLAPGLHFKILSSTGQTLIDVTDAGITSVGGYTGDVKSSFQTADHFGWLLMNGRTLNRADYPALAALFPGAGTTFTIPSGPGKVLGMVGGGLGTTLGATVGALTQNFSGTTSGSLSWGGSTSGSLGLSGSASGSLGLSGSATGSLSVTGQVVGLSGPGSVTVLENPGISGNVDNNSGHNHGTSGLSRNTFSLSYHTGHGISAGSTSGSLSLSGSASGSLGLSGSTTGTLSVGGSTSGTLGVSASGSVVQPTLLVNFFIHI